MAERDDDELAEQLLDLFVYAPLGLALEAKELLPKLAERGRGQVALTRLAGTVAARRGQNEATRFVDEVRDSLGRMLGGEPDRRTATQDDTERANDDLPIAGYADMTAVEVIPLLAGLDADELEQIEAFERDHRARSTVLNRIRQRQGG